MREGSGPPWMRSYRGGRETAPTSLRRDRGGRRWPPACLHAPPGPAMEHSRSDQSPPRLGALAGVDRHWSRRGGTGAGGGACQWPAELRRVRTGGVRLCLGGWRISPMASRSRIHQGGDGAEPCPATELAWAFRGRIRQGGDGDRRPAARRSRARRRPWELGGGAPPVVAASPVVHRPWVRAGTGRRGKERSVFLCNEWQCG
jgi:hypothetical protein